MPSALKGVEGIGAKVKPCAGLVDQSWCAAPATRMGPPLTESPGRCRVDERSRTGSLMEANTAVQCVERCAQRLAGTVRGIGCCAGGSVWPGALQERPASLLAVGRGRFTAWKKPRGHHLRGDGCTRSRRGLEGQVTTATPFAPQGAGQVAFGNPQWKPADRVRSRRGSRKRRALPVLGRGA